MRKLILIVACLMVVASAQAESFNGRLREGHRKLEQGDTAGAMQIYRDLQVEEPESDVLYYSLGCAQYQEGLTEVDLESPEGAQQAFDEARTSFAKVLTSEHDQIRRNAGYNYANALAQIAKQSVASGDHEATISAFNEAIEVYEEFLRQYPEHAGAENNLNHMRYYLKSLMQNPPEQEPQPQQGEGEQQEQQGDEGDEQEQREQQQDQGEQGEQNEQEGDGEQQEQDEQQTAQAQEQGEQGEEGDEQDMSEQDRQTIEALLQSLEEQDNEEQKKNRNMRSGIDINRNWW